QYQYFDLFASFQLKSKNSHAAYATKKMFGTDRRYQLVEIQKTVKEILGLTSLLSQLFCLRICLI
ncbi:MAG: hypothetical protein QXT86_12445, partial [Archaeoglobaceae archaeon]